MARAIKVSEETKQEIIFDSMSIVLAEDRSMLHEEDRPAPFVQELADNMGGYYVHTSAGDIPGVSRDYYAFFPLAEFPKFYGVPAGTKETTWFTPIRRAWK